MLYIQQSLNPNEEIIRVGEFHWWYTFNAALWIVIGVIGMGLVLYGGYYYEVYQTVNQYVPGTMVHNAKSSGYWDAAVEFRGGVTNVIQSMHWTIKLGAFLMLLFGIWGFVQKMIIKVTTEICLTTDRLVLKRGMIARHVAEINVDRIEGVDVAQGMLGRMMNFGFVAVRGMGVGEIVLPQIEEPVNFRRAIERSRSLKKGENV